VGAFHAVAFDKGKPVKPSLKTLEVNLIGVLYSTSRLLLSPVVLMPPSATHLALHYLKLNRIHDSPRALVLLGSMGRYIMHTSSCKLRQLKHFLASWASIPRASLYSASKHAVLGLMRSLSPEFEANNIRIGSIHPFFAGQSPSSFN
jgi:NAD(P)-dependent dehydrogenase (short-subunit alcohol dehydrogenase family)